MGSMRPGVGSIGFDDTVRQEGDGFNAEEVASMRRRWLRQGGDGLDKEEAASTRRRRVCEPHKGRARLYVY